MGKALTLKGKPPEQSRPSKPKIVIFGASGVGKTWFSLEFPKVYYIDAEGGAKEPHYIQKLKDSGASYFGTEDGAGNFSDVVDQIKALATLEHDYQTVVIDSITKLFNTVVASEQERLGDKDAFGASKKPAVAMMRQLVQWIGKIDMNVVLIAHEKSEWGKVDGQQTQIGVTLDCWEKLEYELDIAFRIFKNPAGGRVMEVPRKSRLLQFPEGDKFLCTFENFANKYGRDVIYRKSEVVKIATDEQVKEVTHLLAKTKTDEATIQKWLNAANATSWEEVEEAKILKTIEHLNSRLNIQTGE